MLDHQHRAFGRRLPDQRRHAGDVLVPHSGGGLVEEQHSRVEGERGGDLQRPLAPVRQVDRRRRRELGEADILQQRHRPIVEGVERPLRSPEVEGVAALALQGDAHVLEHGQVREYRGDLEGSHHPKSGDVGRLPVGDLGVFIEDAPVRRRQKFGEQVEARRLARTVRSDQGVDGAPPDLQPHLPDGIEAAKLLGQALGAQDDGR